MPRPPREPPPWSDLAWQPSVEAWIDERLESAGVHRTGPMAPRARPWSIVLDVPTSGGQTWFKSTAPGMANDAGVTPLLAATGSALIVTPLATDPARRWMLLPDVGERLRDRAQGGALIDHWERILPAYAELQRSVEGRSDELLESGALDRRPANLRDLLGKVLEEPWWLRLDEPGGLEWEQLHRLRALLPRLDDCAAELEASGIGASIQNDDLHDGNVLVGAEGDRIIDWGDACLAHPFGTLLVTLRSVGVALDLPEWTPFGDPIPELDRLRDVYLEPWTDRLTRDQLERVVRLATWSGMLARVHAWRAALIHADDAELAEWGDAVPGWLGELAATAPGPQGS